MKKVLVFLLIIADVIGACGCMKKNTNVAKDIESYLSGKYQKTFTFVSYGNDVWSSKTNTYIFCDDLGNEFRVEEDFGIYSDNYGSVLFDKDIQLEFQKFLPDETKVFVSSASSSFTEKQQFTDAMEYMRSCSQINLVIYTYGSVEPGQIEQSIAAAAGGASLFALVFKVEKHAFDEVSGYDDEVSPADIINRESFRLTDGVLKTKSWEE